jgi:protease secretion system outer membrane protein
VKVSVLGVALACTVGVASAGDVSEQSSSRITAVTEAEKLKPRGFFQAYLQARDFEPTFQTAKAERDANRLGASQARSAYFPEVSYQRSHVATETQMRTTTSLSQPIVAMDRYATFQEGGHRETLAELTFRQREQELALRVFKMVADIIRYQENTESNRAKVDALTQQYQSAKRSFELGEGTITDLRDTQVRLGQAKAEGLTISGKLKAALRQFELTCGHSVLSASFRLNPSISGFPVPLEGGGPVAPANTQTAIAGQNLEMGRLATLKARSAFLPQVVGSLNRTEYNGVTSNYTAISVTIPLQAGSFYGIYTAKANEYKLQEAVREAETKAQLDQERLAAMLEAGALEARYRAENIQTAELNVVANEKSLAGGVRSKTDVLNAIQLRFQAGDDYVNTALTLGENYLNYLISKDVPAEQALQLVNQLLL